MNTQLSIVEFTKKQLSQQEQDYMTALRNGKSNIKLKEIEFEIQYLKDCLREVKRIIVPSLNGLSIID
jgi:hypothetical protein